MDTELWAVGLVVLGGMLGAFGPIFLKKGSVMSFKHFYKNYNLILGVFFYGIGTVIFIPALKGGDLSILYPIVSLMYIWVSLLSIKMLGEKMNKFKWIGILLIIIGVSFIGLGS
jgi:uncharacterized membrane protein